MRRLLIAGLAVSLVLGSAHFIGINAAEKFPARPITAIIPAEAGSGGDINTRPLFEKMSAILGKPIMVVNKPGAAQTIGYRELHQAKPDGYTIGLAYLTIVTAKLQGRFQYDYRDFTLIGRHYTTNPVIVASTKTKRPFKTLQEALAFAKAHPGEVSMATSAAGGPYWTAAKLIEQKMGLEFNSIPQEGSSGFIVAQVAGGHVDLGITDLPTAKPQIEAGNMIPLVVIGPARLSGNLSHLPTFRELGNDISIGSFGCILGPPKMPKDVTEIFAKAVKTVATGPEFQKFIIDRYEHPIYLDPEQLFEFCAEQEKVYRPIYEKAGLLK
jgi:tripartite-type tricarboxylate transporter receptor subunit TctC